MADEDFTVTEQNAIAHAEQMTRRRMVRDAFVACFGHPGKLSPHGQIVMDFLDAYCQRNQFKIEVDDAGQTDTPRSFCNLGRRMVIDEIHRQLNWKENPNGNSISGSQ